MKKNMVISTVAFVLLLVVAASVYLMKLNQDSSSVAMRALGGGGSLYDGSYTFKCDNGDTYKAVWQGYESSGYNNCWWKKKIEKLGRGGGIVYDAWGYTAPEVCTPHPALALKEKIRTEFCNEPYGTKK